jgi:hypothetical protein
VGVGHVMWVQYTSEQSAPAEQKGLLSIASDRCRYMQIDSDSVLVLVGFQDPAAHVSSDMMPAPTMYSAHFWWLNLH